MTLLGVDRSDLIKTIEESDDIAADDSSSEEEDVAQPKKNKAARQTNKDFEPGFSFVSSQKEYMRDTWNDISKYVKKKAKTNLDDKIAQVRKDRKAKDGKPGTIDISDSESSDSSEELSDDELVEDKVKIKEGDRKRKLKKREKNPTVDSGVDIQIERDESEEDEYFDAAPVYNDTDSFYTMNLSRPLLKAIEDLKYVHPTPIQAATIPVALLGRDICGCAATGTGKTAAYMLPVLERLLYRPVSEAVTRVLVLVPTRELGVQVYQVTRQLAQFTTVEVALSVGGLDLKTQENMLRRNPDIVIATPGRLIDHVKNTPTFGLESIEVLILDEADRMLDECFLEQMKEVVRSCSRTRQTLLFSATMTDQVEQLATVSLNKPVKVFVDSNKVVAWNLKQEFVRVRNDKEEDREALLAALVCRTFRDHAMVFIQTKVQCHRLHIVLGLLGVRVGELHGNMSQPQRLDTLKRFKDDQIDVLLATDVAARGLDIRGVKTVINYTMPTTLEHYIHRVGRTARAGRAGRSVSIAGEGERKMVKEIVKRARDPVKSRTVNSEVLEKYRAKLKKLEDDVSRVLEEEKAEREIAKLENRAGKIQNLLDGKEEDRAWFQTKKQRMEEKQKLKKKLKDPTYTKTKQKKKQETNLDPAEAMEMKKLHREADFIARQSKRKRKEKKIRSFNESDSVAPKSKKQKKKSSFESELVNTSDKSVKAFRHVANKKKNDDRRLQKKGKPGGRTGGGKQGGKQGKKSSFK